MQIFPVADRSEVELESALTDALAVFVTYIRNAPSISAGWYNIDSQHSRNTMRSECPQILINVQMKFPRRGGPDPHGVLNFLSATCGKPSSFREEVGGVIPDSLENSSLPNCVLRAHTSDDPLH